jgi:TonB family protein
MAPNIRFWRNLTLIGLAHAALITGLVHWSRATKDASAQSVVWINGGAGDGTTKSIPKTSKSSTPPPDSVPQFSKREVEEERPVLTSVESEIQLPNPTPKPTASSTPRPTPKATPKPKPSPTDKPIKKKLVLAKGLPKPSPKPKSSEKSEEEKKQAATERRPRPEPEKMPPPVQTEKPTVKIVQGAGGKGTSPGGGGRIGGAGGESQFGWYGSMLHDRLYSEWAQPTAVASSGEKFSVLVKLRIQKDGRVTDFEIVKPSGNATIDQSVGAVANRVTQVDPLPAGLGNGDHYDVKINFELSSE